MKTIPLRNRLGEVVAEAIVDDQDYGWVSLYRWYKDSAGYVRRDERLNGKRVCIRLHRAMYDLAPGDPWEVDHIHGNRMDHRRENLRLVSHAEQGQNVRTKRPLPRGVYRSETEGVFYIQVKHNGVKHNGGRFRSVEEADDAVRLMRKEILPYATDDSKH